MRRRTFLLAAAASGLSLAWRSLGSWPFTPAQRSPGERLAGLLRHEESARAVGREYLRAFPAEASPEVLTARLGEQLPSGLQAVASASDGRLRELLLRAAAEDFGDLRVVELRGWVLARTEARLCALAALRREAPPS
jgi:hypothetical protein